MGHAVHAVHAPVHHAVHHAPVVAHAVHAAPAYHAPVETYPDEVSPYTYTYAVADDYSRSNFNAEETSDGAGSAQGSYSVALPDGRIQHVTYTANGYMDTSLMSLMREPLSTQRPSHMSQPQPQPTTPKPSLCFVNIYLLFIANKNENPLNYFFLN